MKKLILVLAVLVLAGCSQAPTATQEPTSVIIPTVTTAPTPIPTAIPEPTQDPNDIDYIVCSRLNNEREVWFEDAGGMSDNQGGQFGFVEIKKYNEAENVFEFGSSPSEGGWAPLNTLLDAFDPEQQPGSAQAILFKFIAPTKPEGMAFDFMGPNEFAISFSPDAKPKMVWMAEFREEPFSEDFTLEAGKTYNVLMAIDAEANFKTVVWEDGNFDNHAEFSDALASHENGEGYKNQSWKFILGFDKDQVVKILSYRVSTFDFFN